MKLALLLSAAVVACVSSDAQRRQVYDAHYQQALSSCGRPELAFQSGYNSGYAHQRMDGEWTEMCVPEARGATFAAYQQGFLQGANNAPIQVVHTVRGVPARAPARTATTENACTFDSDCGDGGYHCRDHECLGHGWTGDRCVFNEDCANDHCFGGTCRE